LVKGITLILFILFVALNGVLLYQCNHGKEELEDDKARLEQEIIKLKEKFQIHQANVEVICQDGMQGAPRYIHCGESFVPSYATCVCTTMCLEDYSMAYSNREKCKDWTYKPITVAPKEEPDEEDEDEDDEDGC
jgi:hypothetical protein